MPPRKSCIHCLQSLGQICRPQVNYAELRCRNLGTLSSTTSRFPSRSFSFAPSRNASSSAKSGKNNASSPPPPKGEKKPGTLQPPTSTAPSSSSVASMAKALRSRASATTETYVAYGATQRFFEACSAQADYTVPQASQKGAEIPKTANGEDIGVGKGPWYQDIGLLPTFSSWSQVTFLHMYLITVRLRAFKDAATVHTYSQHLLDHFSHNAENRMITHHGMTMRGVRNRFLKDLFLQWRGILAAYDEGLASGDAVLGAAVWRNLWKASYTDAQGQEIDWEKVAMIVAYMRRVLGELAKVDDVDLVASVAQFQGGNSIFRLSQRDRDVVQGKSASMDEVADN